MNLRVSCCLALAFGIAGCGKPLPEAPVAPPEAVLPASYQQLSPDAVQQLIASSSALGILDVRDEAEMRNGNGWIANAQSCPYFSDYRARLQKLDRSQPWLVYCAIGGRAEYTAATMAELGFQHVARLKGGFEAWRAAGKPVAR